jgi:hypothetical protein
MPYSAYPIDQVGAHRSRGGHRAVSLAVRMRTRWQRRRLDEQLGDGTDPASSPELTLRAAQLRSYAIRSQLADRAVNVVDEAARPERLGIRLQPHRAEIRDSADELLELARRLRAEDPVSTRGAAKAALLLSDGAGPLSPDSGEPLRPVVSRARRLLDPSGPVDRRAVRAA